MYRIKIHQGYNTVSLYTKDVDTAVLLMKHILWCGGEEVTLSIEDEEGEPDEVSQPTCED